MRTGMRRLLAGAVLGLALGLVEAGSLWSQDREVPERGLQVTGSYRLGDIETVNTKNGNVMLSVPLASLPPGRGGDPGFDLTLNYNSKLWDLFVRHQPLTGTPTNPLPDPGDTGPPQPPRRTQYTIHRELRKNFANPGWHYSYDYLLWVEDRRWHHPELNNIPTNQSTHPLEDTKSWYVYKVWMVFPDGSARLFRPEGELDPHDDDYFRILPSGWRLLDYNRGWERTSGSKVSYYSVDGSYLRLEFEADAAGATVDSVDVTQWRDNPWTLYFPDGRRVQGAGATADRLIDRNGNLTTIDRVDDYDHDDNLATPGVPAVEIRDDVGRVITVRHGAGANGETLVSQTGALDEATQTSPTLTWKIKWSDVKPCRAYYVQPAYPEYVQSQETPGAIRTSLSGARLRMVEWIEPPAQLGGSGSHRFSFGYNATPAGSSCGTGSTGGFGEISSVRVPSAAGATYTYKQDGTGVVTSADFVLRNSITSKVVSDGSESDRWDYRISANLTAEVEGPDGGKTRESWDGATGVLEKVEGLGVVSGTETVQEVTERVWGFNIPPVDPSTSTRTANPYVKAEYRTLATGAGTLSKTAVKTLAYDQNGNLTQADEYDWVDYSQVAREYGKPTGAAAGTLKRRTLHTYHASGTGDAYHKATSPPLLTARASTEIRDGPITRRSRRVFTYDNARTTGNLKRERIELTSGNAITISHTYDSHGRGNRTSTTDGRGGRTEWSYGAITGSGSPSIPNLYPTSQVVASGRDEARTTSYDYDFETGAVTSVTDADNGVTTLMELDDVGRPIVVREAWGKSEERQTLTWYCDRQRRMIVRSDLVGRAGAGELVTVTDYDRLGRVSQTRSWESGAPPMPSGSPSTSHCGAYGTDSDSDRAVIKVKTHYQSVKTGPKPGRYTWTSNPYRETREDTAGWTRTRQDPLGRGVEVALFSGDSRPSTSGTGTLGTTVTAYDAEYTTATDPAGRKRRSRLDGLGRLVRVDEPNSSGSLGSTGSPVQATSYSYDALGNLTRVSQGSQTRSFTYDSLSRLTRATNPESGITNYSYDANGNLTGKTDARGVATTYSYDRLDRLTGRSYRYTGTDSAVSLETTRVVYAYDNCGAYARGRLCSVTASKGETEASKTAYKTTYNRYDALGRVLGSTQTTGGTPYRMVYAYDRAGHLVSQTYPSGKVIKTVYDGAGRVAGVKTGIDGWYAGGEGDNAVTYEAHGGVRQLRLGNGLWEQRRYNARLQPVRIELVGTEPTGASRLRLDYGYGTASNNGNVLSQRIRAGTLNQTQTYTYDMLNRLKTARETGSGTGWSQTYQYDRYGNRAVTANSQGTASYLPVVDQTLTPQALTSFNTSSNRLKGLVAYDGAGNLTQDWGMRNFKYDGENRMVDFNVTAGGTLTHVKYRYDGEGRRVQKEVVGGRTTTYVYNILGQLVAEFGGAAPETPGTQYLTPDHLGSTRVVTDDGMDGADPVVLSRLDYLPFGQEIEPNRGNRSAVSGYTADLADGPAQKFTGKERDTESRLDYFGARYFGGAGGRFTSVDPLLSSGQIGQPQSWNRYSYGLNNPLRFVDPSGLYTCDRMKFNAECEAFADALVDVEKKRQRLAGLGQVGAKEDAEILGEALQAYGNEGDENGVAITFGPTGKGTLAETTVGIGSKTKDNPIGQKTVVTFANKGATMPGLVAHEGIHVRDGAAAVAAVRKAAGSGKDLDGSLAVPENLTYFVTEMNAFAASAAYGRATGSPRVSIAKTNYVIWKKKWATVDIQTMRANRDTGIKDFLANDPKYMLTREKPGRRILDRKRP